MHTAPIRPELPGTFDHLTDDGLRSHVLAVSDYVATLGGDGPEARRYQAHLDSARAVLRQRLADRSPIGRVATVTAVADAAAAVIRTRPERALAAHSADGRWSPSAGMVERLVAAGPGCYRMRPTVRDRVTIDWTDVPAGRRVIDPEGDR